MKPYKIHRFTVRHVLGVPEFSADLAGGSAVVTGSNAAGKSSIMRAIAAALGLERTSLARLAPLKDGEPAKDEAGVEFVPEVVLLLKGDGPDLRISAVGDKRFVEEQEGAAWRRTKRPVGGLLERLVDPLANPAAFLSAKPDQQIQWVLEALPCEGYDRRDMLAQASAAGAEVTLKPIPAGLHPLDDIEEVFGQVFAFRTDVGREKGLADATAQRMLATLPAEAPANPTAQLSTTRGTLDTIRSKVASTEAFIVAEHRRATEASRSAYDRRIGEIRAAHLDDIRKIEDAHKAQAEEIRAAAEKRIAALRAEADVAIDAVDTRAEDERTDADQVALASRQEADSDLSRRQAEVADMIAERERLASECAALEEQARAAETDARIRAEAKKAEGEAAELAARYAALTRALDAIKAYRARLAGTLPISGLEVRLGEKREVLVDGVAWATVNTARRAQVALELAMLRSQQAPGDDAPRLCLALMDDAEHFDKATLAAIQKAADAAGVQLILAEVASAGGALEVR